MSFYARTVTPGDGSTHDFPISWPYLATVTVQVYVVLNGLEEAPADLLVEGVGYTYSSPTVVHLTTAPDTSHTVVLKRATPLSTIRKTIPPGTIASNDLNVNYSQLLYVVQEAADAVAALALRAVKAPYNETGYTLDTNSNLLGKLLQVGPGHFISGAIGGGGSGHGNQDGYTPEDAGYVTGDAATAINSILSTGKDVYLPAGKTYPLYSPLQPTTNYQKISGPGKLAPVGNIIGVLVTGGLVGVELDLVFNSASHTGTAVKISNAHRTTIHRLICEDVFSVLHVEGANTTVVQFLWATARGKGITWYGHDTLRSDLLFIGFAIIGQTGAPTQYGLDWDGNCHSFECQVLGLIGGKGAIIRNTAGVATFPAIGRFTHIESDYSNACGIDIQAGLDYDIAEPYILGPALSGIRIGATINSYEVRVGGGKSVGSAGGYGIENAGGPMLIAGNTALYSNFSGETLGNVWNRPISTRWDDTFFAQVVAGSPTLGWDTNDYDTYDRTSNVFRRYIGAAEVAERGATYAANKGIQIVTDGTPGPPPSINGIETRALQQTYGNDFVGRVIGRYSADSKGVVDYAFKSRNTVVGSYTATQLGDKAYTFAPFADTGTYMGHLGQEVWSVDAALTGAATEVPGAWYLYTCTGDSFVGNRPALYVSYQQKLMVCGPNSTTPSLGTGLSAILTLGVGSAAAGTAPLKLTVASAALNTTPEPGAFETDGTDLYFTNAAGTRKKVTLL
jgi:hypothetical protein